MVLVAEQEKISQPLIHPQDGDSVLLKETVDSGEAVAKSSMSVRARWSPTLLSLIT